MTPLHSSASSVLRRSSVQRLPRRPSTTILFREEEGRGKVILTMLRIWLCVSTLVRGMCTAHGSAAFVCVDRVASFGPRLSRQPSIIIVSAGGWGEERIAHDISSVFSPSISIMSRRGGGVGWGVGHGTWDGACGGTWYRTCSRTWDGICGRETKCVMGRVVGGVVGCAVGTWRVGLGTCGET